MSYEHVKHDLPATNGCAECGVEAAVACCIEVLTEKRIRMTTETVRAFFAGAETELRAFDTKTRDRALELMLSKRDTLGIT